MNRVAGEITELSLNPENLAVSLEMIEQAMGYRELRPPEYVAQLIPGYLEQAADHLNIRIGWRSYPPGELSVTKERLLLPGGVVLNTGTIITRQLRGATALAVFLVSCGSGFDQWVRQLYSEGDHLAGYLCDTIGSEFAESAAAYVEALVREQATEAGVAASNRYSPGYCQWAVSEQQILFPLLPSRFCGVQLLSSSLMVPIKSISGIIGIGKNVAHGDYHCSFCDLKDCYKRMEK
jgi:hypothetical protein